jgi:alpha-1,2-mannosyltransferase
MRLGRHVFRPRRGTPPRRVPRPGRDIFRPRCGTTLRFVPRPGRTGRQVLTVAALAAAVAAFLSVAAIRHGFFDLRIYHGAINFWVHDHGEIYDYLKLNSKYGYTYPPFAALLMLPLAYVSWAGAIALSVAAAGVATAAVLWWLVDPIARREGWTRWYALGVGIGLATAVKLTPGIFLLYLVVTGRWRAAATAAGTAAGVTVLAGALAPNASREFWTQAVWNTDRVGSLSFISNQSLQGVVARLELGRLTVPVWLLLVVAVLVVWAVRCRRALAAGPAAPNAEATGLALTGVVGCLVSPVTWVHHLVWLLPALILLVDSGLAAPPGSRRRRRLLGFAGFAYALLVSRFVWIWEKHPHGPVAFVGGNAYVWVSLALLLALPAPVRIVAADFRNGAVSGCQPSARSSIVDSSMK